MAIIVFDDFDRPDDPSSLGTATTGQVWVPYDDSWTPGDLRWEILSNQAARLCGGNPSVGGGGYALVETGLVNCVVTVTINNADFGGDLNNSNFGIIFRWEDDQNYIVATWSRSGQFLRICRVKNGVTSCTNEGFPGPVQIQNGDTLKVVCCDLDIKGYHNDVLTVTIDFGVGFTPLGTMCGLQCGTGVIEDTAYALFDDFTVETNVNCEGALWTLPPLIWTAEGTVETPVTPAVSTQRFDAGEGSNYYLVSPVSDGGDELRGNTIKTLRATGRLTNASMTCYGYNVGDEINTTDLEAGTNASTRSQALNDTTQVAQSKRKPINVKGAVLSALRIEGDDTGNTERDEIHELVSEWSEADARR